MGRQAVLSHSKSVAHIKNIACQTGCGIAKISAFLTNKTAMSGQQVASSTITSPAVRMSQNDQVVSTVAETPKDIAATSIVARSTCGRGGGMINQFMVNQSVTDSEILWAIKVA